MTTFLALSLLGALVALLTVIHETGVRIADALDRVADADDEETEAEEKEPWQG